MELKLNFTTPAQSCELLTIGVPTNSADCYYYDWAWIDGKFYGKSIQVCDNWDFVYMKDQIKDFKIYPCWSAGRLIEIYELVTGKSYDDGPNDGCTLIERLLFAISDAAHRFDFSKLD